MKAASSSECYKITTPRHVLPHYQFETPSSSTFSNDSQRSFSNRSSLRSRYKSSSLAVTSSSLCSDKSNNISSTDCDQPNYPHFQNRQYTTRQVSKVLTPTITSTSSTSFSKSHSRTSRSLSNSTQSSFISETHKETSNNALPCYPFSSCANKQNGIEQLSPQQRQHVFTSLGSSNAESNSNINRVPSSYYANVFPPVVLSTEASEGTDTLTETDDLDETEEQSDDEDQVYQSFKQSVKMLGDYSRSHRETSYEFQSKSPTASIQSDSSEVEQDALTDSLDDEAVSFTEEDLEGAGTASSNSSSDDDDGSMSDFFVSKGVPKAPMTVRVKVEKAVPHTCYDDRVKVTVQVQESDGDEHSDNSDDKESQQNDDEISSSDSDTAFTNSTVTVRYQTNERREDDKNEESSYDESESEIFSGESEGELASPCIPVDKTDYLFKTPLFPPITGVTPYRRDFLARNNDLLSHEAEIDDLRRNAAMHELISSANETASNSGENQSFQEVETSVDSSTMATSDSANAEQPTALSSVSESTTNSNSDLSFRSQSARSSLTGRVSAIHKMYSVGGKLRSLSARRSMLHHRLQSSSCTLPRLQVSTDSVSSSISSNKSDSARSNKVTGSINKLETSQLSLAPSNMLSHSRSLSASLSKRQFSAALRQLSLGNIQAMNPPFPKSSASTLAEKVFKGESFPPITPSIRPSSSASLKKPRSLTRNLTYTIRSDDLSAGVDNINSNTLPTLPPTQSTEHITLRQLILNDRTSSSSSTDPPSNNQDALNDLLFPANFISKRVKDSGTSQLKGKPPAQVSFATNVIEHSLSSSHTLESLSSEQAEAPKQSDTSTTEESSQSYYTCRLTGRRLKKLTDEEENELLNKDYLTFQELQEQDIDKPDARNDKLQHFALDTIRKQMEMERRRIESLTEQDDEIASNSGFSDDEDESESSEDSSEEDEEECYVPTTPRKEKDASHIPMAAHETPATEVNDGEEKSEIKPGIETNTHENELEQCLPTDVNLKPMKAEEESTKSPEEDINKSVDNTKYNGDDMDGKDEELTSLLPTRLNSAESGYRAMPPSRAESTRENSLDPEELEKEKERLMQQLKETGSGAAPGITTSMNSTSSHMILGGELITINYSRPNTASESSANARIQNGIDLTQELPGEEKKIAAVWEEFNRDEREGGAMADYEFSTLLDEMIMDVNSYKPMLSTTGLVSNSNSSQSQSLQVSAQATSSSWEQPKFDPSRKYTTLSELVSLLSHNLRLVSAETLEDHMASLISLISSVLRKVRKNKTEDDYVTQIACLSAIRVLCDRLQEMTSSQNLKYADLSWLFRVLCKYSSDSDSKIRPEASFCLARLVKVAGPALVVRPIYFILVMESEGGTGKSTTGAKTKAAAIDTLTYAMLTFPKEDFHNLEEIAGWVCLAMLNEERRIRQSALECLSIISQHLGGRDKALPLFHTLFLKEELDHFSRSPSPESHKTSKTGKSSKRNGKGSDPIPLSVHGTVRLLTGPGFPIAQPIDAITARLDKDVLPVPSTKGLIEYAVNVPTGKDLVLLMTHMLDKDDDEWDFSSSTDSLDSGSAQSKRSSVTSLGFSDIDWTGEGPDKNKNKDDSDLISPDVAYILLGKGRVNKSDVVLLDTYKKEIIPEIIQMLNEKNKQGRERRNKKRWWKNQKNNKKRRRKGNAKKNGRKNDDGKIIPTLSFDMEDSTFPSQEDQPAEEISLELEEQVFHDPNSPVAVVVDPPQN